MNLLIEQGLQTWVRAPDQFGKVVAGRKIGVVISVPLVALGDPVSEQQLALFDVAEITSRVWAWLDYVPTVLCVVPDDSVQVDRLGESVVRRYFQLQGITMDFPSSCFQSSLMQRIARSFDLPQNNLAKLPLNQVADRLKGESVQRCLQYAAEHLTQVKRWQPDEWVSTSAFYDRVKGRPLRMEIPSSPDDQNRWAREQQRRPLRRSVKAAWEQRHRQHSDQLSVDRSVMVYHSEFLGVLERAFTFPIVMQQVVREQSIEPLFCFDEQWRKALSVYFEARSDRNENPSSEAAGIPVIGQVFQILTSFGIYEPSL